jgi:hypothetical protein
MTTSSSVPDNGGDHSGGGGSGGTYVDDVFSTYLYKGTNAEKDIVNGVDLAGEGGMAWLKQRTGSAKPHYLFDTERGNQQSLSSNDDAAAFGSGLKLKAFNSDGFRLGAEINVNGSGEDYTSWTFRKAPKFFDVVTYTGDGSNGRSIDHALGISPGMVIVKRTDSSNLGAWWVWHTGGGDKYGILDGTSDFTDASVGKVWGDGTSVIQPDDSRFTVGEYTNQDGGEYVAYVFAHDDSDESMIKCGSFSSPAKTTFEIDIGFEPEFFLVKKTSGSGHWYLIDSMRGFNSEENAGPQNRALQADTSNSESADEFYRPTARGVQGWQLSAHDYIYLAIRRPNKPAEEFEPEELFAVDTMGSTGDSKPPAFRSEFPVDMAIRSDTGGASHEVASRLTQGNWLYSDKTDPEKATTDYADFDFSNGWSNADGTASNYVSHM